MNSIIEEYEGFWSIDPTAILEKKIQIKNHTIHTILQYGMITIYIDNQVIYRSPAEEFTQEMAYKISEMTEREVLNG